MSTTLPEASANAACNAVVDLVDADSPTPGYIEVYAAGPTLLFTVTLDDPAFGDAGAVNPGEAIAASLPLFGGAAVAAGTAATFTCFDGNGVARFSGDVGGTLQTTTGALQLVSSAIALDDVVEVTALTYTAPLMEAA